MCAPPTSPRVVARAILGAAAFCALMWAGLVVGALELFHLAHLIFGAH